MPNSFLVEFRRIHFCYITDANYWKELATVTIIAFEDHLVRVVLTSLVLSLECYGFFCPKGHFHDDVILLVLKTTNTTRMLQCQAFVQFRTFVGLNLFGIAKFKYERKANRSELW